MADACAETTTRTAGSEETRAPGPAPLGPDDRVPLFRGDLVVQKGASPGLFDVEDPVSGRRFTLYEFELTVGRMLDGRRTVAEVVANGVRLGIPVDVPGLNQFVRQMWNYGFLADGEPPPGAWPAGGGTWSERKVWDEETRALFQTGLRLMRLGRGGDARSYFEAILDGDPDNPEATEMLGLLDAGRAPTAAPLGGARPDAVAAARRRRRAVTLVTVALAAGAAGALTVSALRPAQTALAPEPTQLPAPAPAARPPASLPASHTGRVVQRVHPRLADVVAPGAGRVVFVAADGARVARGERIAALHVEVPAPPDPALERRIAELGRLAGQDAVYQDFLEKARRDRERARERREVREVAIVAPAAGRLARGPEAARSAAAGEAVGHVLDPARWWLTFSVDAAPPSDALCEVLGDLPAERAPCRVVARSAAGERVDLVAEVAARDAPWLAGAAAPVVRLTVPISAEEPIAQRRLAEAPR